MVGFYLLMFLLSVLIAVMAFLFGMFCGSRDIEENDKFWKRQIISRGLGGYECDPETGISFFVWKGDKE